MINEIKITSLIEAEGYASGPDKKYNIWVSAVDREDKSKIDKIKTQLKEKNIPHFHQFFYDFSDEDSCFFQTNPALGPQKQNIQNIISFLAPYVQTTKEYNLGVNCFAGISRSSAIGIIAISLSGKSPEESLQKLVEANPHVWPNLRVLRFASEILNKDLVTPVKLWKASQLETGMLTLQS
jgi:hypothetical protein